MRITFKALLGVATGLIMVAGVVATASAQSYKYRSQPTPSRGDSGNHDGGHRGGGWRGPGWGAAIPGILMAIPQRGPSEDVFIDDGSVVEDVDRPRRKRQPPQRNARRNPSGAPPANERRLVPDEVVIELRNTVSPQQVDALQARHRLTRLGSLTNQLSGTTIYRWRIPDRRSVATVIRQLEAENLVASAQPNYRYALQQTATAAPEGDPAQYELAKLRLPQAHALTKGDGVLVAVVDSGVDASHPELAGSIAGSFDALATKEPPNKHGTAIAGLIAAHGRLMGAAPAARLLAVRVFDAAGGGTTFDIVKGLDYAATQHARIINMSFAGPPDPIVRRSLTAADKMGIVLIAAAGNAGPKSPPLYPAAYPDVIAVSASDADNKPSAFSNRGRHIAVTAPGTDIMVAIPDGEFEVSSGTSYSAAEVAGVTALMLARDGKLTPAQVRRILTTTAQDIGPKGRDSLFGAGLADAFGAVSSETAAVASDGTRQPIERVSTGAR
ncbi:MAG: S8 family serine peptidase [Rhodopseudomonas sp.]|nr:S8 family serine peptidase [Rhodopseudomonas sp.]